MEGNTLAIIEPYGQRRLARLISMGAAASSEEKYAPDEADAAAEDMAADADFDLSAEAAAAFMKTVAPVLAHAPEADREALMQNLWRAAGVAWHDRDDEVAALAAEVAELRGRTLAAPNKFERDAKREKEKAGGDGPRIVVVSSRVPDRGDLVAAVRDPEWVLDYDYETATAETLVAALGAKAEALGGSVRTVALCNHGPSDEGTWAVARSVTAEGEGLGALGALARGLGALPGIERVDLLACDLAATPGGLDLVKTLEGIADCDFAASVDVTANLSRGGDWILETDDVDAAAVYFDAGKLDEWDGLLRAGLRNGTSKFLRRQRERKKRRRRGGRVRVSGGKPSGRFHHQNHDPPLCALM